MTLCSVFVSCQDQTALFSEHSIKIEQSFLMFAISMILMIATMVYLRSLSFKSRLLLSETINNNLMFSTAYVNHLDKYQLMEGMKLILGEHRVKTLQSYLFCNYVRFPIPVRKKSLHKFQIICVVT